MKVIEQLERMQKIIKLIQKEKTGTPNEFAENLNISRRCLFDYLDNFRILGAEINYSKQRNTYYFSNGYQVDLSYSFKIISNDETREVFGGYSIMNYKSAFFMHSA